MTGVKVALEALQKALPTLPMGSDLHGAVLKAVTELSKHLGEGGGDSQAQIQQLIQMARAAHAQPQQDALARMGGAPPGAAPPGAGAPPPPMGA